MQGVLRVKVRARAKNDSVTALGPYSFTVEVRAEAAANAANRRMLALLAAHLGVAAERLQIVNGHHRPNKLLRLRGAGRE